MRKQKIYMYLHGIKKLMRLTVVKAIIYNIFNRLYMKTNDMNVEKQTTNFLSDLGDTFKNLNNDFKQSLDVLSSQYKGVQFSDKLNESLKNFKESLIGKMEDNVQLKKEDVKLDNFNISASSNPKVDITKVFTSNFSQKDEQSENSYHIQHKLK